MRRAPDIWVNLGLASAILIWGHAFLWMKTAGADMTPAFIAGARAWIGVATAGVLAMVLFRRLPSTPVQIAWCCWVGVVSVALPFVLMAWAAQRLPTGVVGVYMAVIPLLILPLAHVLSPILALNERMTLDKALGVAIGAVGVGALFGPEAFRALGSSEALAQIALLCAAASYAIGSISIRAMPQADPIGASVLQLGVGSLLLAPIALPDFPTSAPSSTAVAALMALGVGATGVAMVLRVYIVSNAGPVFFSTAGYLIPPTALAVGWWWADERFEPSDLAGGALILLGLAIARGLLRRVRRAMRV